MSAPGFPGPVFWIQLSKNLIPPSLDGIPNGESLPQAPGVAFPRGNASENLPPSHSPPSRETGEGEWDPQSLRASFPMGKTAFPHSCPVRILWRLHSPSERSIPRLSGSLRKGNAIRILGNQTAIPLFEAFPDFSLPESSPRDG